MHLDKTCKIEFFKEHQNSTNPKDKCYLIEVFEFTWALWIDHVHRFLHFYYRFFHFCYRFFHKNYRFIFYFKDSVSMHFWIKMYCINLLSIQYRLYRQQKYRYFEFRADIPISWYDMDIGASLKKSTEIFSTIVVLIVDCSSFFFLTIQYSTVELQLNIEWQGAINFRSLFTYKWYNPLNFTHSDPSSASNVNNCCLTIFALVLPW